MKPSSRGARAALGLGLLIAVSSTSARAGSTRIYWLLDETNCFKDPNAIAVSCGEIGTYHFYRPGVVPSFPEGAGCVTPATTLSLAKILPPLDRSLSTTTGSSIPSTPIPAPTTPVFISDGAASSLLAPDATTAPTSDRWIPCAGGSCFDKQADLQVGPWVAVVDWNNEHGWSVGWTIRSLLPSGTRLGLFSLTDPQLDLTAESGETTDVHVIGALCRIFDQLGANPPLVVNMSFGHRSDTGNLPNECGSDDALQCEVGRLLERLYRQPSSQDLGTVLVGAAGNHHELLFPAAHPSVIPAGMADLEELEEKHAVGAWETPAQPQARPLALIPGNGLCLSTMLAGHRVGWGAPGGSSYSAAIFSAWMAAALLQREVADPLAAVKWSTEWWWPTASCTYRLRRGEELLQSCSSAFAELFDAVVLSSTWNCPTGNAQTFRPLSVALTGEQLKEVDALAGIESLTEVSGRLNRPAPSEPPCISCEGPGRSQRLQLAPTESLFAQRDGGDTLQLALHRSAPLSRETAFRSVLLRTGKFFYPIALTATQLKELAGAGYSHLAIQGAISKLEPGVQPSLVFVMSWSVVDRPSEIYWTAAPILLLDGP